jgi:hypothetical protein
MRCREYDEGATARRWQVSSVPDVLEEVPPRGRYARVVLDQPEVDGRHHVLPVLIRMDQQEFLQELLSLRDLLLDHKAKPGHG